MICHAVAQQPGGGGELLPGQHCRQFGWWAGCDRLGRCDRQQRRRDRQHFYCQQGTHQDLTLCRLPKLLWHSPADCGCQGKESQGSRLRMSRKGNLRAHSSKHHCSAAHGGFSSQLHSTTSALYDLLLQVTDATGAGRGAALYELNKATASENETPSFLSWWDTALCSCVTGDGRVRRRRRRCAVPAEQGGSVGQRVPPKCSQFFRRRAVHLGSGRHPRHGHRFQVRTNKRLFMFYNHVFDDALDMRIARRLRAASAVWACSQHSECSITFSSGSSRTRPGSRRTGAVPAAAT